MLICLNAINGLGQTYTEITTKKIDGEQVGQSLSIGDSLPTTVINNTINNNNITIRTSDYKNKLLILDFWSTSCISCLEALPLFDKLQRKFDKKVKILAVTQEKYKDVNSFWKKNGYTKNIKLTFVVNDLILSSYFPHVSLPHEVWIYNGRIIAITNGDYVDEYNIKKVLAGEKIDWVVKKDFRDFDSRIPLFKINVNQINQKLTNLHYVAISGYLPGIGNDALFSDFGIIRDKIQKTIRVYILNASIYNAFIGLTNLSGIINSLIKPSQLTDPNQVIWNVSDKNKYQYFNKNKSGYISEWMLNHSFCYESLSSDTGQTDEQLYKQVMSELNLLLGLDVQWKKQSQKVYVLIKNRNITPIKRLNYGIYSSNLVHSMNQRVNSPYVFDETGENLLLPENISKYERLDSLNMILKNHGLILKEEEREVDKLMFNEKIDLIPNINLIQNFETEKSAQFNLNNSTEAENNSFLSNNKFNKGVVELSSGLQYKVIRLGKGNLPKVTDRVKVNYTGMQVNGKIFESTLASGVPKIINISDVISGLKEALQLMPEGSKWLIYIPPSLAYGKHTLQGSFIPNSTLIFKIELLNIIN